MHASALALITYRLFELVDVAAIAVKLPLLSLFTTTTSVLMPAGEACNSASPRDVVSAFATLVDGDSESALSNFLAVARELLIMQETWWSVGSM
jgi:hypothetical protein